MILYVSIIFKLRIFIGKTTFFVANQANLEDMPAEKLTSLESEHKVIEETNKALLADVKSVTAGGYMHPAKQSHLQVEGTPRLFMY